MDIPATDVAVVGAGPIGLELAAALKKAKIDYLHFDARQIGYTVSWFPPLTKFFSSNERLAIASVPLQTPDQGKATREQYLMYLRGVVEQFDLQVRTYEPVVGIDRANGGFVLTTDLGGQRPRYRARHIVLCTGGTDRPRRLQIPGEDLPHVSHYFRDPHVFFRKRLLVIGGRNSAVESALRCHHAGAKVSISYRRSEFDSKSIKYWLLPEINGLISEGKITAFFNTVPKEITSRSVRLDSCRPTSPQPSPGIPGEGLQGPPRLSRAGAEPGTLNPEPRTLSPDFDFVLVQIGYEQDATLLELAGIELHGPCRAPRYDERTMETNVPGVYVAGTSVAGTQDKYRLFIENCHVHVARIVAALTGSAPPAAPVPPVSPET